MTKSTMHSLQIFLLSLMVLLQACDSRHYQVWAYFNNVGNLQLNAPVKMAGVLIGKVTAIEFDETRSAAKVTLQLDGHYQRIPNDTIASIYSTSLLGGEQYVGLEIGGSPDFLKPNAQIEMTQSAVILEQLLGQLLYQATPKP